MLCSLARHFTLTVPLSIQVYKWVPANLMLGEPCDGLASHPGGSRNAQNRNRDKLPPDGPLDSNADYHFVLFLAFQGVGCFFVCIFRPSRTRSVHVGSHLRVSLAFPDNFNPREFPSGREGQQMKACFSFHKYNTIFAPVLYRI